MYKHQYFDDVPYRLSHRNLCEFWALGQAGEMPLPQGQRGETHRSIYLCFLTRFVGGSVFQEGCVFCSPSLAAQKIVRWTPERSARKVMKSGSTTCDFPEESWRIPILVGISLVFSGVWRPFEVTGAYEEVRDFNVCLGSNPSRNPIDFEFLSVRCLCIMYPLVI